MNDHELQAALIRWKNGMPRHPELFRIAEARAYGPHPNEPRIRRGWPDATAGRFDLHCAQSPSYTFVYGVDEIEWRPNGTRFHRTSMKDATGDHLSWSCTIVQAVDDDWDLADEAPRIHVFSTGGTCRDIMEHALALIDDEEAYLLEEMRRTGHPMVMYGLA